VCGFGVLEGFVVLVGSWCVFFVCIVFDGSVFVFFCFGLAAICFFLLLSFNQFWCFCCFGGFGCPVVLFCLLLFCLGLVVLVVLYGLRLFLWFGWFGLACGCFVGLVFCRLGGYLFLVVF
jgi:hypothetical protein